MKRPIIVKFLLTFICAVAGMGVVAAQAPPAGASAEVCQTARDLQLVCVEVRGSGGYVREVWGKGYFPNPSVKNPGKICDYVTKVRISGNGNTHYRDYENRAPKGQCGLPGGSYNIVPINQTFPKGFYVCTTFFINENVQQGSEKCIKLT